ncbi:MAG: tetratricopeptide repeat protein [Sphingomonadales bacterium]
MGPFYEELKRRNVVRVGIAYLIMGWVLLQIVDTIAPGLGWPDWVMSFFIVLIAIGFPIALFFSWAFELTPEGVKKTAEVDADASITHSTGRKLDFMIIGALTLDLGYFAWDKFGADQPAGPAEGSTATAEASIAVLPFVNMSPDASHEYFSDGISEELLNLLVKVDGLKVAGRTSSFAFKGRKVDLREIGAALGVDHVLEGSVRREGNTVRITAQLIRSSDGFHLWSETYDRELVSVFAIQDEIAAAIVKALEETLAIKGDGAPIKATAGAAPTAPRADIAVYDLYLLAQSKMKKRSTGSLTEAKDYLERALAQDPDYVPALTAMAENHILLSDSGNAYGDVPMKDAYAAAKSLIDRALTLDPSFARAHAVLGLAEFANGNMAAAEAALKRARSMDGQLVEAVLWLGLTMGALGEQEEADRLEALTVELEPLWALPVGNRVSTLGGKGQLAEARALIDGISKYQPDNPIVIAREAQLLLREGREAEAIRLTVRGLEVNPGDTSTSQQLFTGYMNLLEPEKAKPFSRPAGHVLYVAMTEGLEAAVAYEVKRLGPFPGQNFNDWVLAIWEGLAGHHQRVLLLMDPYLDEISDGTSAALRVGPAVYGYATALKAVGRDEDAAAVVAAMKGSISSRKKAGWTDNALGLRRAQVAIIEGNDEQVLKNLEIRQAGGALVITNLWEPGFAYLYENPRFLAVAAALLTHVNEERAKLGLGPADTKYLPWEKTGE